MGRVTASKCIMPKSFGRFNKILSPDACRTHPPRGELPWLLPELWGIQPRKPHSRTQKTRTVSAHLSPPRHRNCPCSRSVQGRKRGRSPRNRGPPLLSETTVVGKARGCRLRPGARARAATPSLPLPAKWNAGSGCGGPRSYCDSPPAPPRGDGEGGREEREKGDFPCMPLHGRRLRAGEVPSGQPLRP